MKSSEIDGFSGFRKMRKEVREVSSERKWGVMGMKDGNMAVRGNGYGGMGISGHWRIAIGACMIGMNRRGGEMKVDMRVGLVLSITIGSEKKLGSVVLFMDCMDDGGVMWEMG